MAKPDTYFLPPERVATDMLKTPAEYFKLKMAFDKAVASIDGFVMVLNDLRQMVWANDKLTDYIGASVEELLGKRPGELFCCKNAQKEKGGCGVSWDCQFCGMALAIKSCLADASNTVNECSLLQLETNKSFQFRVKTSQIEHDEKGYLLCVFFDISQLKRLQHLESAFVHDIANLAGSVNNLSELISLTESHGDDDNLVGLLKRASGSLISTVEEHRLLIMAEQGNLNLVPEKCNPLAMVSEMVQLYREKGKLTNVEILFENTIDENISVTAVPSLFRRSVENLIKNASEHVAENGTVSIVAKLENREYFLLEVSNSAEIEDETLSKLFTRSFSTKGIGRGTGLYSVKLFLENYLHGTCGVRYDADEKLITFYLSLPIDC